MLEHKWYLNFFEDVICLCNEMKTVADERTDETGTGIHKRWRGVLQKNSMKEE